MTIFWKETNPAIKRDLDQTFKSITRDVVTCQALTDLFMHRCYCGYILLIMLYVVTIIMV